MPSASSRSTRILEGAGGDSSTHVPGHDAADLLAHDEGVRRQQGGQQRAVSAARQARRSRIASGRPRPLPRAPGAASAAQRAGSGERGGAVGRVRRGAPASAAAAPAARRAPASQRGERRSAAFARRVPHPHASKTTCNKEREHESNHCARRGRRHRAVRGFVDDLRRRRADMPPSCRRAAKAIRRLLGPGLHFKLPPPFQTLTLIDTRISRSTHPTRTVSRRRIKTMCWSTRSSSIASPIRSSCSKETKEHAEPAGPARAAARTALAMRSRSSRCPTRSPSSRPRRSKRAARWTRARRRSACQWSICS